MANFFEVIGIASAGSELADVQRDEQIRVLPVEMSREISPLTDLIALCKLVCILKKERPLIVHTHTPKAGIIGMLASKIVGIPNRLHTVAGMPLMETTGAKRKLLVLVEKLTYSCATFIYPNSKGLFNFILQNEFAPETKLKVIANGSTNGIDTAYFCRDNISVNSEERLREDLGISRKDFVFIFVGRLVGDKGINELVRAFANLINTFPYIKLLLVGAFESDLDPLHRECLEELRTNTNILKVGFKDDVRPYFAISDVLVFPSYREGFPNVVMQAGAMGLPSIVTDINGCNEIIIDGKNGIIVPKKDENELLNAMERLVSDVEFYSEIKRNSRKMIVDRYDQHAVWYAILKEYKSLDDNV